jgi:hypothetical protein
MKKLFAFCLLLITSLMIFAFSALADLPAVPDGDPLTLLLNLVMNYKTMGPLALGVAGVTVVMQVLKKFVGDFKYKRLVVTALSVAYAVLLSLVSGLSLLQAAVAALITGGGAVALYEAIKGLTGNATVPPPAA